MITEDYINFETAKLLKEKGFDERTNSYFIDNNEIAISWFFSRYNSETTYLSAPTLQMVMKWLREEYSLEIYPYHHNHTIYISKWWFEIIEYPDSVAEYESNIDEEYDTYEEACEAAIKYCLENLI